MKASTLRWLIVIALVALWEILPRTGVVPELFLPSLSSTLVAGWNEAGEYGGALLVTLYEVVAGFALGATRGTARSCASRKWPGRRSPAPERAAGR